MLWSYLKVAIRSLAKYRSFTLINVTGLAASLACCIFILLYVFQELSVDKFHANSDRIYRVASKLERPGRPTQLFATTPLPLSRVLKDEVPGIEESVRLRQFSLFVQRGTTRFQEHRFCFSDPEFFNLLSFPLQAGDPARALNEPFAVVLTAATARKYFGEDNAVGRILTVEDTVQFKVTGILSEPLPLSHLQFDFLASFASIEQMNLLGQFPWWSFNFYTYLRLSESESVSETEMRVTQAAGRHVASDEIKYGSKQNYFLQAVRDIYLHSNLEGEIEPSGDATDVKAFGAIAALILLIACTNFVNLSTARSLRRGKEVGIHKTLGAQRKQVVWQSLVETGVILLAAFLLAVILVSLLLPVYNQEMGSNLQLRTVGTANLTLGGLALLAIMTAAAGAYPAFFLSALQPGEALKGKGTHGNKSSAGLRFALVSMQFAISSFLIVTALVIYDQVRFMKSANPGFAKQELLVIPLPGNVNIARDYEKFKKECTQVPGVIAATATSSVPGKPLSKIVFLPEGATASKTQGILTLTADHDVVSTLGLELAAGREFRRDFGTDADAAFLINEAAVLSLGWAEAENALGREINWGWPGKKGKVVGVIRNYHQRGLQDKIEPILLHIQPSWFRYLSLRVKTENLGATLSGLQERWRQLVPSRPFEYFFLNEAFNAQYRAEVSAGKLLSGLTLFALLISALGLFGLAAYTTEQRTKEIAVRKTLGATSVQILIWLWRHFTRPVFLAVFLAAPATYWILQQWLAGFAYRITLSGGTFVMAGAGLGLLALLAVSLRSIKAANANPVIGLRYE